MERLTNVIDPELAPITYHDCGYAQAVLTGEIYNTSKRKMVYVRVGEDGEWPQYQLRMERWNFNGTNT